ncbi:MAG TPA: phosphoribosylanthranilate isomerase [Sandaracinaceae bacterium LLY-WYZ-13_1]|nr:phosphoribosylanthranilate isomerase [Sandaracinaceae bacterium LLY-WYZ-13_1]
MRVKVCGITSVDDALACVDAGADALGLNFWPRSVRRCAEGEARRIVEAVGERARLVAVVVDAPEPAVARLREAVGIRWIQLHGDEPPEALARWLPEAYKAVRPASAADVDAARAWGGEELLVDARVPGAPGGTGVVADWDLARSLARERRVWLAGGLHPDNVAEAVRRVDPYGVDVASGVESAPGVKDRAAVRRFVERARAAA